MRRGSLFFGLALILFAGLFFLKGLGVIADVLPLVWPLAIILFGVWLLIGGLFPLRGRWRDSVETFTIDLQGAAQGEMELDHGAGKVIVTGGAPEGKFLEAVAGTAMDYKARLSGDMLKVDVSAGPSGLPFLGPEGGVWRFRLTERIPLSLEVNAGAASMDFDLTDLQVKLLKMETGASSTQLKLPANAGQTVVEIECGAASYHVTVPHGVAARVSVESGFSALDIDESRFPRQAGGFYQSPDFNTAANRAEIRFEGGASSITVA